jgi:serine/threonine-protein kinase
MAVTVQQFIERLSQSGLMSAAEISAFQDGLPPDQRTGDVKALVAALYRAGKLTKYQAQAVYDGKTKGLAFGEYVVLDKLGEGGMGAVLKARHRRMDRVVAVKILPTAAMKTAGAVERFHREVKAAAKLMHSNIVTAFDAAEHQGMHYLAMEYVEGKDLATIVKDNGPMGVREAVECTLQAARGLQYAHEQGIVHRDIKPGNLLLDKKGTVKILDMGLARIAGPEAALGGPERLTTSGQVMGTCDYMAPEQAIDTHAADHRSDIYSLGCTLYRLLTGQPPYQGETLMMILLAHQQAPIPSLCEARPEVPEELDAVYQRMLAKQPEDRQQSMVEVVAELETVLAALTGQSLPAAAKSESSSMALAQSLAFLQEDRPASAASRPRKVAAAERTQAYAAKKGADDTGTHVLGKARGAARLRQRPLLLAGIGGGLLLLGALLAVALWRGPSGPVSRDLKSHISSLESAPPPPAIAPFDAAKAKGHQAAWAKHLGLPVEITNPIGMELVLIPPGEFPMGSPDLDQLAQSDEKPQHRVRIIRPFYMGKYEVTWGQWSALASAPGKGGTPQEPASNTTWEIAHAFVDKLNEKLRDSRGS